MINVDNNSLIQLLEACSKVVLPLCSLISIILTVKINRANRENSYNVASYTIKYNSKENTLRNRRNLKILIMYTRSMIENAKEKDDIISCLPTAKWFDLIIDSKLEQNDVNFLIQWFEQISHKIRSIKNAAVTNSNTVPDARKKLLSNNNMMQLTKIEEKLDNAVNEGPSI